MLLHHKTGQHHTLTRNIIQRLIVVTALSNKTLAVTATPVADCRKRKCFSLRTKITRQCQQWSVIILVKCKHLQLRKSKMEVKRWMEWLKNYKYWNKFSLWKKNPECEAHCFGHLHHIKFSSYSGTALLSANLAANVVSKPNCVNIPVAVTSIHSWGSRVDKSVKGVGSKGVS